jgi:8-oxo-dGTP pyrophosphatase MutT (NUDIX family)
MTQPHRQCAAVIIQDNRGRILFLEQQNGVYGIPGGIVEVHETPPMAAIREALEEACIEVEREYIIGTYLFNGQWLA